MDSNRFFSRGPARSRVRDMTQGAIAKQLILYALPLMLGNVFQMLYNTVDAIVVGNFVGKEALAAVSSTTSIVNILVFFFNGFSVGAGVLISRFFGAKDHERLHAAIETTMAATFLLCVILTATGIGMVGPALRLMATPADVMPDATLYLRIYFAGITGLLVYNMGSGILRAVGDTLHPLLFLVTTSVLNIVLDLAFVIGLHAGISGVAYATILSQLISAALVLGLLTGTKDVYRLSWRDLRISCGILTQMMAVGIPTAFQSVITSVSNVFMQSYVNFFGSVCMAGWGCYMKFFNFVMLPMHSMAMASTTFVSQNIGAGQTERADRGTRDAIFLSLGIIAFIATVLFVSAPTALRLFTREQGVIDYGVLFIRTNIYFAAFNCINHVLAGALRGRGDSRGPMIIMLISFVAVRQIYLYVVTNYVINTPTVVGFGFPLGWMTCAVLEVTYFLVFHVRRDRKAAASV